MISARRFIKKVLIREAVLINTHTHMLSPPCCVCALMDFSGRFVMKCRRARAFNKEPGETQFSHREILILRQGAISSLVLSNFDTRR